MQIKFYPKIKKGVKEGNPQYGKILSSLQSSLNNLNDVPGSSNITLEISKDVDRLKLIGDKLLTTTVHGQQPTLLFAQISYNYNKFKFYTDLKILPGKWDHKNQRAQNAMIGAPEFNLRLTNIKERIQQCFNRYLNDNGNNLPTPQELKKILFLEFKKKLPQEMANEEKLKTFWGYFQHFIDQSVNGIRKTKQGNNITKNTISNYKTLQVVLADFEKSNGEKIKFESVDLEFYSDLLQYLEKVKKYKRNTIQTQFRILKTVMSESFDAGYHSNSKYNTKKFAAPSEDVSSIYLNEDELIEL
jgi:hypothetical protein